MERTDRAIEEVLRRTVNLAMDNCDELLAGVELAINTTVRRVTGMFSFHAVAKQRGHPAF